MSSKAVCFWLRFSIIAVAVCGAVICGLIYPYLFLRSFPENKILIAVWCALVCAAAVPCYTVLFFVWKISTAIKNETVFTEKNAKIIKLCAQIVFIDLGVFFVGNLILALLNLQASPLILFCSFLLIFAGFMLALFAAILSRYVAKAAALQEENEGTI